MTGEPCRDARKTATVTLPLAPGRYAFLQADWPLTSAEWEQLQVLLTVMRVGLVLPEEAEALESVFGWLRASSVVEQPVTAEGGRAAAPLRPTRSRAANSHSEPRA